MSSEYSVEVHKATIQQNTIIHKGTYDDCLIIADTFFKYLKLVIANGHAKPYCCLYIKQDDKILMQFGSK